MSVLFLIIFVNVLGFGLIIPLLPFYGEHFNASPDQVTLLMAVYSATQFITAPFWGRWSDRYGRRPILLISLAGTVATYVWMALASDLASLFWARALGGVMAGSISASFAYAADITTEENRAKGMGLIGAAFGLGFIAGPAIGGLLAGGDPTATNFQLPSFAIKCTSAFSGRVFGAPRVTNHGDSAAGGCIREIMRECVDLREGAKRGPAPSRERQRQDLSNDN